MGKMITFESVLKQIKVLFLLVLTSLVPVACNGHEEPDICDDLKMSRNLITSDLLSIELVSWLFMRWFTSLRHIAFKMSEHSLSPFIGIAYLDSS